MLKWEIYLLDLVIQHKIWARTSNTLCFKIIISIYLSCCFYIINLDLHCHMHAHLLCIFFLLPINQKKDVTLPLLTENKSSLQNTKEIKRKANMTHYIFFPIKAVWETTEVKCHVNNIIMRMMMMLLLLWRWFSKVG